jgi:hypothetical protein
MTTAQNKMVAQIETDREMGIPYAPGWKLSRHNQRGGEVVLRGLERLGKVVQIAVPSNSVFAVEGDEDYLVRLV